MKNIFNFKLAKNEFNLLKTILFLITIVYVFIIILAYTESITYNARYADQYLTSQYMVFAQLLYYTSIFIVSLYSFKYIYNRKALDMYHALPVKKTTLLLTKLTTGYISFSILFAIAFYIVASFNNLLPKEILQFLSLSLLSGLFEYSCFMLVATICNGIFFHILLTASILFIPVLISLLVSIFNQTYTFIYSTYPFGLVPEKIYNAFFVTTDRLSNGTFKLTMYAENPQTIIFMVILTIAIILLSIYSYSLRKSEKLSNYIVFKPVRILFQSCITFIITVLIVRIFMSEVSIMLTYIACIILSISLTFILDCILNFKITKIKYNIPYYITSLLGVLIFINVYYNNLYGLFNTPTVSNVQEATISGANDLYGGILENMVAQTSDLDNSKYTNAALITLTSQESINKLIQLQDSQFEKFSENEYGTSGDTDLLVSYTLNNGKAVLRRFKIDTLDYVDDINYIQYNSSNKQDVLDILSNASKYYTTVELNTFVPTTITDNEQDELLQALIQDVTNDDLFRSVSYQSPVIGSAMLLTAYTDYQVLSTPIMIKFDYTNTLQVLGIDANSFDVLVVPEQEIQYIGDSAQLESLPNHYVHRTRDILRAQIGDLPYSYSNTELPSLPIDYLIEELQLDDYAYLTGNDTSAYWNSEEYIADWLQYPTHLNLYNLIKIDNSQYYRTFIVIDDKVLMTSEQLVRLPN